MRMPPQAAEDVWSVSESAVSMTGATRTGRGAGRGRSSSAGCPGELCVWPVRPDQIRLIDNTCKEGGRAVVTPSAGMRAARTRAAGSTS